MRRATGSVWPMYQREVNRMGIWTLGGANRAMNLLAIALDVSGCTGWC